MYHWSEQIKQCYDVDSLRKQLNSIDIVAKEIKVVARQQVQNYKLLAAKMAEIKQKQKIAKMRAAKKRDRR
jgi:hypothetical protein